jgi:hypothetical protein
MWKSSPAAQLFKRLLAWPREVFGVPPVCSVIVVSYNGLRHLPDCLDALERLACPRESLDLSRPS